MSASACGYSRAGQEQRGQRFRALLERSLGPCARAVHVDAVRSHAHQEVRPRARTQLAVHCDEAVRRLLGEVLGQRGDRELVFVLHGVRLGDDPAEPGLRHLMIGAVHQQHVVQTSVAELVLVVPRPQHEALGVVGHVATVGVRAVEVLGAHARTIGCFPPERGLFHDRRHSAPHDRVFETRKLE